MRRIICILLAFLTVATIIPLAACRGIQTPVSVNEGASSGNQGTSSGNQSASSGNQGTSSGNQGTSSGNQSASSGNQGTSSGNQSASSGSQGSSDENQDAIIGVWVTEDMPYDNIWTFASSGTITIRDRNAAGTNFGSWEKQGNLFHVSALIFMEDFTGTGMLSSKEGVQTLTLSLNDGRTLVFTRDDG